MVSTRLSLVTEWAPSEQQVCCVSNNGESGTLCLGPTDSETDLDPKEALGHSFVAVVWDENLKPVSQRLNCMLSFPTHELAGTQAWEKYCQAWFTSWHLFWKGKRHPATLRRPPELPIFVFVLFCFF